MRDIMMYGTEEAEIRRDLVGEHPFTLRKLGLKVIRGLIVPRHPPSDDDEDVPATTASPTAADETLRNPPLLQVPQERWQTHRTLLANVNERRARPK
jgi:hypothetical protein